MRPTKTRAEWRVAPSPAAKGGFLAPVRIPHRNLMIPRGSVGKRDGKRAQFALPPDSAAPSSRFR